MELHCNERSSLGHPCLTTSSAAATIAPTGVTTTQLCGVALCCDSEAALETETTSTTTATTLLGTLESNEKQCHLSSSSSELMVDDRLHQYNNHNQEPCDIILRRAPDDLNLLRDDRVLHNLLDLEDKYMPSPSYFRCVQKDIEPWMRNRVATWMLEVCEEQKCEDEVFPTCMSYIDRFLSVVSIHRTQLQLLGAACMFIASKLRETVPLNANKLVIYTDNSINLSQLMEMERSVLRVLKWDICTITPHDFLEQILTRLPLTPEDVHAVKRHAQTFIALCIATEFNLTMYPPSMIAVSSVSTAIQGLLGLKWSTEMGLHKRLQAITGIDHDCLRACQEQIEKTLSANLPQSADHPQGLANPPFTPQKGIPQNQPTTPTDVRDIDFS